MRLICQVATLWSTLREGKGHDLTIILCLILGALLFTAAAAAVLLIVKGAQDRELRDLGFCPKSAVSTSLPLLRPHFFHLLNGRVE